MRSSLRYLRPNPRTRPFILLLGARGSIPNSEDDLLIMAARTVTMVLTFAACATARDVPQRWQNRNRRVLMLISDTGGGHRASALALQAMMHKLRPCLDIKIVDIWTEHGAWPDNQMPRTYPFLCRHRQLWRAMFHMAPLLERPWFATTRLTCGAGFKRCISEYDPHLVVSLHPLCQHLPLDLSRRHDDTVPFATVCTDLGSAHCTWFVEGVDACFVATDAVRRIAESRGVARSKIRQHGLPVRRPFWQASSGAAKLARRQIAALGLEVNRRTVLIVGGGDGLGGLESVVDATASRLAADQPGAAQVVAVCGRNSAARRRLEARQQAGRWPEVSVRVLGFTNEMSEYMKAADCLVSKAGPGTIAEAAMCGLPTVLSDFLPGQEHGNLAFVTRHGFGQYVRQPKAIARHVSALLQSPAELARMSAAARAAATPLATKQIATDLLQILDRGRTADGALA